MSSFPFSAGAAAAGTALPPGACDCYLRVYDSRRPTVADAALLPPNAFVADDCQVQRRMGTQHDFIRTGRIQAD